VKKERDCRIEMLWLKLRNLEIRHILLRNSIIHCKDIVKDKTSQKSVLRVNKKSETSGFSIPNMKKVKKRT